MCPEDADVHTVLGVLYNLSREYDNAIAAFQKALELKPKDYSLWNKLGATQANSARSSDALYAYQEVVHDLKKGVTSHEKESLWNHFNLNIFGNQLALYIHYSKERERCYQAILREDLQLSSTYLLTPQPTTLIEKHKLYEYTVMFMYKKSMHV